MQNNTSNKTLPIDQYQELILSQNKAYEKIQESPEGIILYRGKSMLDGERIIVVATGIKRTSENRKTGDMIQIWILRGDISPILAKRLGEDKSVCGDCKHRDIGSCYVNLCHGPRAVYLKDVDGGYTEFNISMLPLFKDRYIRLGAYGDPAAVPMYVWDTICSIAKGWTGYTHQWNNRKLKHIHELQKYCMASIELIEEKRKAIALGWRTFRVRTKRIDDFVEKDEFICPASKESGAVSNCNRCQGCSGEMRSQIKNAIIYFHAKGCDTVAISMEKKYEKKILAIRYKKAWRKPWKAIIKSFKEVTKI